jgi:hypothetical protein
MAMIRLSEMAMDGEKAVKDGLPSTDDRQDMI